VGDGLECDGKMTTLLVEWTLGFLFSLFAANLPLSFPFFSAFP
jgi:hypothetical protein